MAIINFDEIEKRLSEIDQKSNVTINMSFPNVKEIVIQSSNTYYINNEDNYFNDSDDFNSSSSEYNQYLLEREKRYDREEESYNKALRKYFLAGSLH